eukprot:357784-Chlamydomonas_euryale.AAC.1
MHRLAHRCVRSLALHAPPLPFHALAGHLMHRLAHRCVRSLAPPRRLKLRRRGRPAQRHRARTQCCGASVLQSNGMTEARGSLGVQVPPRRSWLPLRGFRVLGTLNPKPSQALLGAFMGVLRR